MAILPQGRRHIGESDELEKCPKRTAIPTRYLGVSPNQPYGPGITAARLACGQAVALARQLAYVHENAACTPALAAHCPGSASA
jgi:ribosomal protein S12